MKVLAFGEVLWDVYPDGAYIGGAPFNFAAHMAKHNNEVWMCTSIGTDALGRSTMEAFNKQNIHTECVSVLSEKQTGKCLVTLDQKGIPSYQLLTDVAYDYISVPENAAGTYDVLYFGTLALRSQHNMQTLTKLVACDSFRDIFVDINLRPPYYSKETINFALLHATILKISEEELDTVLQNVTIPFSEDYQIVAQSLCDLFPNLKLILITCGEKGACAYRALDKKFCFCQAKAVNVASTVGAGDSFSAAFLSHILQGKDIQESLEHAVKISAYVVSCKDAVPEYEV